MNRTLQEIVAAIDPVSIHGGLDVKIDGLSYDAFTVNPGELFLAVEGVNVDRHQYIRQVLDRGIRAVVHSKPLSEFRQGVSYIQVENVQRAMSPLSAAFFQFPSRKMFVIGVTGTNGKSTTCSFIYQLFRLFQKKTGIVSSVSRDTGAGLEDNTKHQSTPEAPVIQQYLFDAAENGIEYMILETTSHGLSERNNRVGDVEFNAAVMTNVTHEHLEFHGTMEQYIHDKTNLFRLVSRFGAESSYGVVNTDDPSAGVFIAASTKPVYTYGVRNTADYRAEDILADRTSTSFTVSHSEGRKRVDLHVPGGFNVSNALAASLAVAKALRLPSNEILGLIPRLQGIHGRMTCVGGNQPFEVIVDFAHTPDSFEKLLPEMKERAAGRLIVLFGSAGERDTAKRPQQGEIASRYADLVFLADEDPRREDPMSILEDIAAGCRGHIRDSSLFLIPDRKKAILQAFRTARAGDIVLLLGKGHETTISYADGDIAWDELKAARECLADVGYQ